MLSPPPKSSVNRERKRKVESATLLTETPYKKQLEEKNTSETAKGAVARNKVVAAKTSHGSKNRNTKQKPISKRKHDHEVSTDEDIDEATLCDDESDDEVEEARRKNVEQGAIRCNLQLQEVQCLWSRKDR